MTKTTNKKSKKNHSICREESIDFLNMKFLMAINSLKKETSHSII